jgi:hypothetical protein
LGNTTLKVEWSLNLAAPDEANITSLIALAFSLADKRPEVVRDIAEIRRNLLHYRHQLKRLRKRKMSKAGRHSCIEALAEAHRKTVLAARRLSAALYPKGVGNLEIHLGVTLYC